MPRPDGSVLACALRRSLLRPVFLGKAGAMADRGLGCVGAHLSLLPFQALDHFSMLLTEN